MDHRFVYLPSINVHQEDCQIQVLTLCLFRPMLGSMGSATSGEGY
ncbi:MAG: hypothetical protein U0930_20950 [Pirellulales bacterium]